MEEPAGGLRLCLLCPCNILRLTQLLLPFGSSGHLLVLCMHEVAGEVCAGFGLGGGNVGSVVQGFNKRRHDERL